jgi:hypothetical protein
LICGHARGVVSEDGPATDSGCAGIDSYHAWMFHE